MRSDQTAIALLKPEQVLALSALLKTKDLLSDEATSALDPETTTATLALLKRINQQLGLTVVMITHEMQVVKQICDRVVVMNYGEIVESGDVADIFMAPQHETT